MRKFRAYVSSYRARSTFPHVAEERSPVRSASVGRTRDCLGNRYTNTWSAYEDVAFLCFPKRAWFTWSLSRVPISASCFTSRSRHVQTARFWPPFRCRRSILWKKAVRPTLQGIQLELHQTAKAVRFCRLSRNLCGQIILPKKGGCTIVSGKTFDRVDVLSSVARSLSTSILAIHHSCKTNYIEI